MLDSSFDVPFDADDAYELSLPICDTWGVSKKRVLVVLQTIDKRDLRSLGVLGDKAVRTCFKNVLKYSRQLARKYDEGFENPAFAVINFNAKRHLHLKQDMQSSLESEFAARVHAAIAKLKPTHILVSGERAMNRLFPAIEYAGNKNGWVHELKSGKLDVKVTSTLDFGKLLEKNGEKSNLLGFFCRNFRNLLLGKLP